MAESPTYVVIWDHDGDQRQMVFATLPEARDYVRDQRLDSDDSIRWRIERRQVISRASMHYEQPPARSGHRRHTKTTPQQQAWRADLLDQINERRSAEGQPFADRWWNEPDDLR